jgi:hypothetical protein
LLTLADYRDKQRFTPAMERRAAVLGTQISAAIGSALAREREEEEGKVSAALLQVSQATSASLSEEALLPQIAERALRHGERLTIVPCGTKTRARSGPRTAGWTGGSTTSSS